MKRLFFLILILLVFASVILVFMNTKNDKMNVGDYIPNQKMALTYSGGFENAGYKLTIQKIVGNKTQVLSEDTGTSVVLVYRYAKDEFRLVYSAEEPSSSIDYINETNKDILLLKGPIKLGTTWERFQGERSTITGINIDISTPAGSYKTIEITTVGNGSKSKSYYAPGIGQVRSIDSYENFDMTSELINIEKSK